METMLYSFSELPHVFMDDTSQEAAPEVTPTPSYSNVSSPKRRRNLLPVVLFIIVAAILIFLAKHLLGSSSKKTASSITPTPTEFQIPTDTPTPTSSQTPTPGATSTPTPKPTQNPVDKGTGLDRSTLSVEVQNGSGVTGAASKASDYLKSLGYHVVSVGNADNSNYQNVTISVSPSKSDFLSLLKSDLSTNYTIGSTSADLSSATSDARVIIGK